MEADARVFVFDRVREGKGILWGNDVMDADFYLNYEKYL
jgi:hypothetical protein